MPIDIPLMSRNPFNGFGERRNEDDDSEPFVPPHLLEQQVKKGISCCQCLSLFQLNVVASLGFDRLGQRLFVIIQMSADYLWLFKMQASEWTWSNWYPAPFLWTSRQILLLEWFCRSVMMLSVARHFSILYMCRQAFVRALSRGPLVSGPTCHGYESQIIAVWRCRRCFSRMLVDFQVYEVNVEVESKRQHHVWMTSCIVLQSIGQRNGQASSMQSPSTSVRREKLLRRNSILRSTGFIEGGEKSSMGGTLQSCLTYHECSRGYVFDCSNSLL